MLQVRVSPFNPKLVRVIEEYDSACLLCIDGDPQRIVGTKMIRRGQVVVKTKTGRKWTNCESIPVVIVSPYTKKG